MNIKQRHFIRKNELNKLREDISTQYDEIFSNIIIPRKSRVEIIITEDGDELYAVNGQLSVWKSKENYLPVLTLLLSKTIDLKAVTVDMGAVRFVTNGADIMKPGITNINPEIKKDDIIKIIDEKNNQTLAVGKAMFNAEIMEKKDKGKVIKNLHTIQDNVWKFIKNFK
ncbi:MAG: DUF1947 domain-containing protein [Candidatus Lokiarchaeota archaeon]|nr:DUF1947 domain-containing protein [Candidatus Lokiarchaeota archaeon]